MVPGCRESRRSVGDYLLNENDVRANRIFPDAVAYGGWPMDVHIPGGIMDFDSLPSKIFNFDGVYTIPYRSYYSKNIDNLMMAGRDISATKMAMGSTRIMGTCAVGGQAVGTAAALAVRYSCSPCELGGRITELQQLLMKDDCYIPGFANSDTMDLARTAKVSATSELPYHNAVNVTNGVARKIGTQENCWESDGIGDKGAKITLVWPTHKVIREVRIIFDPNLTREIMPSITAQVKNRQVKGMPEELVKDYTIDFYRGDNIVLSQDVRGNYLRLRTLQLPDSVEADKICLTVWSYLWLQIGTHF